MTGCRLLTDPETGAVHGAHHEHPPWVRCPLDPLVATGASATPAPAPLGPTTPPDGPPVDPDQAALGALARVVAALGADEKPPDPPGE